MLYEILRFLVNLLALLHPVWISLQLGDLSPFVTPYRITLQHPAGSGADHLASLRTPAHLRRLRFCKKMRQAPVTKENPVENVQVQAG